MSTLKVSSIESPSTTDGGLAISSTGAVSGGLPYPNRNLLYNGAMQVAQRGTSATGITATGYYTADRWRAALSSLGTWTHTIEADAPSGTGFAKSVKILCTTANTSPVTAGFHAFQQRIEGQDLQRLAFGSSEAKDITLSFWVKSNVTGTYINEFENPVAVTRISRAYTVDTADTWEYKSVTIPGDTVNGITNDNAHRFAVYFWLGAGSTFTSGSSLQTSWGTSTIERAVGQTNLASAVNNYWQVTGVQLETGPVATEFEHRSYGDELARCQRYYEQFGGAGQGYFNGTMTPVDVGNRPEWLLPYSEKRAPPTVTVVNPTSLYFNMLTTNSQSTVATYLGTLVGTQPQCAQMFFTVASGMPQWGLAILQNTGTGVIQVSAEL